MNDVSDFKQKLLALVESKNLREKMGKKGWDFVKEKFSYNRLAKDMETLYLELLELTEK